MIAIPPSFWLDTNELKFPELNQALNSNEKDAIEDEFGDVLFSLINYARFIKVNPESALERTNKKFLQRFQFIEVQAKKQDRSIEDLTLSEMESFWQEAKKRKVVNTIALRIISQWYRIKLSFNDSISLNEFHHYYNTIWFALDWYI